MSTQREDSMVLLERAKSGDDAALERLCARYLPALRRWATGRLPARARLLLETEDLVQETIVATLRNLPRFEHAREGALISYLRTALHNRIRTEIRKAGRRPEEVEIDEALHENPSPSPLEAAIGSDEAARYEGALDALDEIDREAVIARLELGLSFAELASAIGKPSPDAARMTYRRALERLVERMGSGDDR